MEKALKGKVIALEKSNNTYKIKMNHFFFPMGIPEGDELYGCYQEAKEKKENTYLSQC